MDSTPESHAGNPTAREFSASEQRRVFWLTFALVVISWIAIKIVLPALPGLPQALHGTEDAVKLSVSLYLLSFAFSQPFWGALVQKQGCRRTVFQSLCISMVGSLIAMLSLNLPMYIVGRSLEGIGMGAASSIGRTLLADVFDRKKLSRVVGLVSGTAATMPAISPIIGGYLMLWLDWRALFGFVLLLTTVYFYFAYRWLPETRTKPPDDQVVSASQLGRIYASTIGNSRYWGYVLPYAAMMGGLIGYYSAMPYWFHVQLGIPKHTFSYLAVPTVSIYVIGLVVAGYLVRQHELEEVFFLGTVLAIITATGAMLTALFQLTGAVPIVVLFCLFGFSTGLVTPSANAGVLAHFKKVAAPTAALVAVTLFGTASLTSTIAMDLSVKGTLWPVAGYLGILSLLSFGACFFWVRRPACDGTPERDHQSPSA